MSYGKHSTVRTTAWAVGALGFIASMATTGTAYAQDGGAPNPTCGSLPGVVYIAGSSAVQPFIKAMGVGLAAQATVTQTIVYQAPGSCAGVNAVVNDTSNGTNAACTVGAGCITGNGIYWDKSGTLLNCTLDAAGTHVDIGVSDVFGTICLGGALPAGFADTPGPVQAMLFVVPKASTQTTFTAEEGFFTFGFGKAGMVTPYSDESLLWVRNQNSGTQIVIGKHIAVPANKFKGMDAGGSGKVLTNVSTSATPEKTIGILGADVYDIHRDVLTALAFKAFKQWSAYFPDSTGTAFDKKNVRDGHYVPWGYEHLVYSVDGMGKPKSAAAKLFLDWLSQATTGPWDDGKGGDIVTVEAANHLIPQCAMTVQRATDGGDLSIYSAAAPCGCAFENVATGKTSCTACTKDADCGAGKCRHNFCEAK